MGDFTIRTSTVRGGDVLREDVAATNVLAECATFTLASQDATVQIVASALDASIGVAITDPTDLIKPAVEAVAVTVASQDSSVTASSVAIDASLAVTGSDASSGVTLSAEAATVSFLTLEPTVHIEGSTNALAEVALLSVAANDSSVLVGLTASTANVSCNAFDAGTSLGIPAGYGAMAFAAMDARIVIPAGYMTGVDITAQTMQPNNHTVPYAMSNNHAAAYATSNNHGAAYATSNNHAAASMGGS